jgi:UDP-N-acetyl-D-mannosaminuronate dehydrogenase
MLIEHNKSAKMKNGGIRCRIVNLVENAFRDVNIALANELVAEQLCMNV